MVAVALPGGRQLADVPLFGLVFTSLGLGFIVGVLFCWLGGADVRQRVVRLARQNRELEEELTNLRNLPLDNDIHL